MFQDKYYLEMWLKLFFVELVTCTLLLRMIINKENGNLVIKVAQNLFAYQLEGMVKYQ